jgi:hypothetical protein
MNDKNKAMHHEQDNDRPTREDPQLPCYPCAEAALRE